jgi:predicted nuclease of predicted toxin-antitoxin system
LTFLVDAQLPPSLARWITDRGHHAVHVFDLGLHRADDPTVWELALRDGSVIVTKDEDFVDAWLVSAAPPALLWVRKGNCSNRALLSWIEPLWAEAVRRLDQGERFIELRG